MTKVSLKQFNKKTLYQALWDIEEASKKIGNRENIQGNQKYEQCATVLAPRCLDKRKLPQGFPKGEKYILFISHLKKIFCKMVL